MTLLMLLMCSIGVWAQDGTTVVDPGFYLVNKLGGNATVTFYTYAPESNTRAASEQVSLLEIVSQIEAGTSGLEPLIKGDDTKEENYFMNRYYPYVLMHIVPKNDSEGNYWTDEALLFSNFATDESLVNVPSQLVPGQLQPGGYSTRSGVSIGDKLDVNLIQLDANRYDGAGWYYIYVPEEASDGSSGNTIILEGFVVPKFDLSTVTSTSTDGKTLTYTLDGFTSTLSIDDGGTSFTYNGSAQGPTKITNTTFEVKKDSKTISFETSNHVFVALSAQSGSSLSSDKTAVDVGDYTLSLQPKTRTVQDNSGTSGNATTTVPAGIFINEKDIEFKITQRELNTTNSGLTVTAKNKVYDGNTDAEVSATFATGVDGETLTITGLEGTFDNKNVGENKTVTIKSGWTIVPGDNTKVANYKIDMPESVKANITPKPLTATVTAENKEYDATTTATVSGSVATGIEGETLTISGLTGTFADANVGTGKTVTINGGEVKAGDNTTASNYNVSFPKSTTADITAKALTITAKDQSVTYGTNIATGTTQVILSPATLPGNDQLTGITLTPSTTDVTTDGTITPSKAEIKSGETDVTSNYNISYPTGKLTITSATFVEGDVTASGYEGTYDGKEHGIEVKAEGTTIKYGTKEGTYDETPLTYTNVGTYTIYYEVTKANYNPVTGSETVKITAKELTATVTAENKEYDATTSATVSGTVATGIEGETLTISGLTGTFADANVGTGKTVTIDGGEVSAGDNTTASNYSVSIPKSTTADITAKALTITAKDQSVTYGTNIATGTTQVTLSPATLPGNDQLTGISLTPSTTDVTTSGTITPSKAEIKSGEADVTSNYSITYEPGKLTITSATFVDGDVKSEAYSGVYDGKAHTISLEAPEDATVRYGTAKGSCNLDKAPIYTDVSTNTVYFVVTRPNYNPVKGSQTVTITKKELTITAEAKSKIYGAVDPTLTYKVEGLVEGESLDGALTRDEGKDVGEYDILQGTLKATDNYKVTYIGAKLSITRAPLTVKADPKTKEAGEDDPALTYTYDKLVADDTEEVFSGSLTRIAGEEAGEYAIMLGNLSAGDNYDITFQGANLTITAKEPVKPEEPLYKIYVAESVGGEVHTTHTQAKQGQQVNIIIKTEDNYNLESLVVLNNSTRKPITTDVTTDKDNNEFTYFLMPGADVTVAATFVKQKEEFKQNIFILKNYYGEVVSNLLYAEPGQQVNLETRVKDGYTNVLLDELYVFNEKGEQLQLFYLDDPIEKVPVYLFFMKGERAYVYNSFKGTNGITDETKSLKLDGIKLFSLSDLYSNFLKTSGGTEGAELVLSFLANILANFTSDGALHVNLGPEDMCSALMNLQSGWKVKFDFTGIIQLINPELLGMSEGTINLTSGQIYELLSPGNLKLLMKSSESPLLINSITVIPPDSQDPTDPTDPSNPTDPTDPTAIKGMQADKAAGDIFDLRGRKVDENTLQKGVYIRNGRKIVIK